MLRFLRLRWFWLKNLQIRLFIDRFKIDMSQVRHPDITSFEHFNAFFVRAMRADARPIYQPDNSRSYCSPVDGTVSCFGLINKAKLIQAKGIDYSLTELVGTRDDIIEQFRDGCFATIYLSPCDYHRVHMPAAGRLKSMTCVPGRLFSVSDRFVRNLSNLFNRNERVVCLFDTDHGCVALVLVGAIFVGCMDTVWHGTVTPPHRSSIQHVEYNPDDAPYLNKGDEMGRFNMGSTVIVLWSAQDMQWNDDFIVGESVQMGNNIAYRKESNMERYGCESEISKNYSEY